MSRIFHLLISLLLTGCSTVGYYAQSIQGQLDLMGRSQSLRGLIDDPGTDATLRGKLRQIEKIRAFSIEQMLLPDNQSYRSYADIGREALVWSVVATPEFSMQSLTWCYPVIGCATYRGYFAEGDAKAFKAELLEEAKDVVIHPVPAYSTLGWFSDPLPSTVIQWPEARLAGLIFHELAHQKLYIQGDSAFNEAFATAIEQIGVEHWMKLNKKEATLEEWRLRQRREAEFIALLLKARQELVYLYDSQLNQQDMRLQKQHTFDRLKHQYEALRGHWQGYSGYDRWFDRPLNNAHLASVATYESWVPVFRDIYHQSAQSLPLFYQSVQRLANLPDEVRQKEMQILLQKVEEK